MKWAQWELFDSAIISAMTPPHIEVSKVRPSTIHSLPMDPKPEQDPNDYDDRPRREELADEFDDISTDLGELTEEDREAIMECEMDEDLRQILLNPDTPVQTDEWTKVEYKRRRQEL